MNLFDDQFEINSMLKIEPQLGGIIEKLEPHAHAFHVTRGCSIPTMIGDKHPQVPVLFIGSKRMRNAWVDTRHCRGAHITIDGYRTGIWSPAYLSWSGAEFSFAIDTFELQDLIRAGEKFGEVLVVYVADTLMAVESFSIDKNFLNLLHVANHSRYVPRFVPGQDYIDARLADFPPLISPDELRFIGAAGEPVYLASSSERLQGGRHPQLNL